MTVMTFDGSHGDIVVRRLPKKFNNIQRYRLNLLTEGDIPANEDGLGQETAHQGMHQSASVSDLGIQKYEAAEELGKVRDRNLRFPVRPHRRR